MKNASIEDQTRHFLQRKYDDQWKKMNPNIEFDFNQESGHNNLRLDNFTVETQVDDRRDDILNTVVEKRNNNAKILFSIRFENEVEVQGPINGSGTLHIWSNGDS
ncbi:TPA_asm: hypothetical protein GYZ54_15420, partial [Listeria monocytogenes]|nr:hypothetical protein [Listeria monocytogenes]